MASAINTAARGIYFRFNRRFNNLPHWERSALLLKMGLVRGAMRRCAREMNPPVCVAWRYDEGQTFPRPLGWAIMVPAGKAWKNLPQLMVFVAKDQRRKGIGARLAKRMLTHTNLWEKVILVGTGTKQADQFFEATGFKS